MSSSNYFSPISRFFYNNLASPVYKASSYIYNIASENISPGNLAGLALTLADYTGYNPYGSTAMAVNFIAMAKSDHETKSGPNFYNEMVNSYLTSSIPFVVYNTYQSYNNFDNQSSFKTVKSLGNILLPIIKVAGPILAVELLKFVGEDNKANYYNDNKSLVDNIAEHHRKYYSSNNAHYNQQDDIEKTGDNSDMFSDL